MTLQEFKENLDKRRIQVDDDMYEYLDGRVTHCHLVYTKDGKEHLFEVRSWKLYSEQNMLRISAVNWSLTAGTCIIELTEDNIDEWDIRP